MKYLLIAIFFCLIGNLSAEDDYHMALGQQLSDQFGISGGEWMISDNEIATNNKATLTGVTRKKIAWEGDEPFSEVLELKIASTKPNRWDNAVRFVCPTAVNKDDVLLLVIWMKGIEANEGFGNVQHIFELTEDPYTKSLSQGGELDNQWRQWMLPFTSEMDYPAGKNRYQINLGYMSGTIQIAGLAVINYGKKYKESDLPETDFHQNYIGREEGAQWRIDALNRIEQVRKGEMTIKVVNKNNGPIKNATIKVNMVQHNFGFGTAVSVSRWLNSGSNDLMYRSKLEDLTGDGRSFNIAVIENGLKWPAWEGTWAGTKDEVVEVVDWLKSNGMRVRGHNLVWPLYDHLPDDLEKNKENPEYIKNRIREHIFEEAGYDGIKGYIDEWDVINEMSHCLDLRDVFQTEDIYTDWMNWAYEADSNALMYINEYSIINGGGNDSASRQKYKEIIERLINQGAPLRGLGVQGHMGTTFTAPQKVLEILDDLAQYNLDLSITEYDAADASEEVAADYMRDILIASFSHPAMQNFLMWGFYDGSHWYSDAPLFRSDWSLKPSGQVFIDYVFNKWWTNTTGTSNRDGNYSTQAFYGTYDITAEFDGVEHTEQISFTKDTETVVLKIDTEATLVKYDRPETFFLYGNYPNPFNNKTVIKYHLPASAAVDIAFYDITGRSITRVQPGKQNAGIHECEFDASLLNSGVYLYRLTVANRSFWGKMLLTK